MDQIGLLLLKSNVYLSFGCLRRTYYTVHTGLQILWSIHKRLALEITILIIMITIVII